MTHLRLGFRNLFRQKRRTAISLAVITFGMGCLLLTLLHSRYIDWGLRESTIHTETGHLQIFDGRYFTRDENTVLEFGLEDAAAIRSELSDWPDVDLILARIDFMGLLSNGDKSVACLCRGVEPAVEKELRGMYRNAATVYDAFNEDPEDRESIALGKGLARSLSVAEGDYVTLMSTTSKGALNALDLKVVGTFSGYSSEYDARAAVVPLETAQMLLQTRKVKNLLLALNRTENTDRVHSRLLSWAGENDRRLDFKKWHERAEYYRSVKQFYDQMTGFMTAVLMIVVFFSTSNTVVMSVVERTREIGTLMSLGTSRAQTLRTFFFEGMFIGLIGGFLSMVFSWLVAVGINSLDLELPPPPGLSDGYPLLFRHETVLYLAVYIATLLVVSLSSLLPALRATRLKIVDALGHI